MAQLAQVEEIDALGDGEGLQLPLALDRGSLAVDVPGVAELELGDLDLHGASCLPHWERGRGPWAPAPAPVGGQGIAMAGGSTGPSRLSVDR